jgi:peptidoglycan/LPS O-acetylase OafA/YrhL
MSESKTKHNCKSWDLSVEMQMYSFMCFNTYLAWRRPSRVETWCNKHYKYSYINAYTHVITIKHGAMINLKLSVYVERQ